jgi:CBS domain-containing protein
MTATAREIIGKKLITIRDIDSLAVAHRMMKDNKIRHLPVENDEGEVIGVLSQRDIMRATESKITYEYGFIFEDLKIGNHLMVEDYMTSPVESVPSDTPLKLVAQKMLEQKISCYLVTEKGEIVGIVTTDDLLKYLVFRLDRETDDFMINIKTLFTEPFARVAAFRGSGY